MYQINPNLAQTELYGTGKNEAQVFDTSIAEQNQRIRFAKQESDKVARAKKLEDARKRSTDLLNNQIGEVHPSDIPDFNKASLDYRNKVLQAFKEGGGDISIEKEAELNQMHNVNVQNQLASKKRAEQERVHLNEIDNPNNPHREREVLRAHQGFATASNGDYSVRTETTPMFNIEKEVVEPMSKDRLAQVEKNKILGKTDWTSAQAAEDAKNIVRNPLVARELHERVLDHAEKGQFNEYINDMYSSPKDNFGLPNASYISDESKRKQVIANTTPDNVNLKDIAAYEYANKFYAHGVDPQPKGNTIVIGGATDRGKYRSTYNPNTGELTADTGVSGEKPIATHAEILNPKTGKNEDREISNIIPIYNPKTNELIGGKYTLYPNDEEKAKNREVEARNAKNATADQQTKKEVELSELEGKKPELSNWGVLTNQKERDAEYKSELADWQKKVNAVEKKYATNEPVPYPNTIIKTDDANLIKTKFHDTWGKTLEEVKANKAGFSHQELPRNNQISSGKKDQIEVDNKAKVTITSTKYSPSQNKTYITYSDGKIEVKDGK